MADLELAAATLERHIPHLLDSGDPNSQSAIAARARGMALVVRSLKEPIAFSEAAPWDEVSEKLQAFVTGLAQGSLAAPSIEDPITATPPPKPSWRHRAIQITRTLLVIIAPPLVAFLLPLAVPLSGPGVTWLRLATVVWALLALIISLDQAINEKVSQMRTMLNLLRDATPPPHAAGQEQQDGPVEQIHAGGHIPGVRTRTTYTHKPQRRRS